MEFGVSNGDEQSGKAQCSVIFWNDIVGFVEHIVEQRDLLPNQCMIKAGIDEGDGFSKVCMYILNIQKEQTKHKFSYSKGACS